MNYLLSAIIFLQEGGTDPVGVPALVPIAIGVILLLLFIWGLNRNNISQGEPDHANDHHDPQLHNEPHSEAAHHEPEPVEAPVDEMSTRGTAVSITEPETPATPDDLKIIEGIGPKIEDILHAAGITTFAILAATSVEKLEQIVREDAGIRVAFPDTWPEQANLAATGNWSALETLQDELKGGRRA